jgi:hypothetical protein
MQSLPVLKRCSTCGVFIRGFPPNKKTTRRGNPKTALFAARTKDYHSGDLVHRLSQIHKLTYEHTPTRSLQIMRKFLSCGLITAFAILPTALRVYAEPPPMEPVVVSTESAAPVNCGSEKCF